MATHEATATASSGATKKDKTTTTTTDTLSSGQQPPVGDSDEVLPDADDQGVAESGDGTSAQTQPTAQGQSSQSQQPPPPPPPPPGPRAGRLQALFASSLDHTLNKISWDNFAACYPTAAAKSPQALKTVHRAMVDRLGELCTAEFAVVMRNRDVVRRLNELETLSSDAHKRRLAAANSGSTAAPSPPHTLPAETVLAAHLAPQRKAQRQMLEERLAAVQAANTARFAKLTAQQTEAGQLVAALERALADAEGAAALLDGAAENGHGGDALDNTLVAELARETRAAEVEMTGI
ncbi:hypothetical protein Sste5346_000580 [Sporothrix stenoceras]|uniref:Mind kinetochore complex component n=1 Tax=Sporothrix stenoceras TaxID=5173 RepID=A0ABR3ZRH9_9PEZI